MSLRAINELRSIYSFCIGRGAKSGEIRFKPHGLWEYAGLYPSDFTLAESARLMPDTASPLPASVGAYAGLIS